MAALGSVRYRIALELSAGRVPIELNLCPAANTRFGERPRSPANSVRGDGPMTMPAPE
jgi:hypothetical protein